MKDLVICGDILRAKLDLTHKPDNTRWFSALIRKSIEPLGVKSHVLGLCPSDFNFDEFYQTIYEQPGPEVLDKWAKFYDGEGFDEAIAATLRDVFLGKTIIFFEGSRSLLRYADSIGCQYLNFRVGPLRFGADLVFIIESNNQAVTRTIKHYAMDEAFIQMQRTMVQAQMSEQARVFERPTLVFLGQVQGDASLISDGQFTSVTIPDGLDIARFAPGDIFHKPHPTDWNQPEIDRWMALFPSSQVLDMPTYPLFCSQGDLTFVTVSSGSGYEAEVFGHECHFVSPHNWALNSGMWERFTPVLHEYWYPEFWRAIFMALEGQPLDAASINDNKQMMAFAPERLRSTIGARWAQR